MELGCSLSKSVDSMVRIERFVLLVVEVRRIVVILSLTLSHSSLSLKIGDVYSELPKREI